ncbi:MAG: 4Fe-4S binding protein [Kiritimatiellae bacterium]|nr:4Fe-4S binding protein [Kiritimatiellia bacterium]MDD5520589.1 4Fe-4S binding protein [Kiritimatiellia bacterium]
MRKILVMLFLLVSTLTCFAENRFPKPQFEKGYTLPETTAPGPRSILLESVDVVVLLAALSLATWLVLKKRSRRGVFLLTIFSVIYFGFWKKGCICSIGAIQNVTLWLFDNQYVLPLSAAAYFILPLVFALLFGRVFCAAVCPLGTIQDLMILFPVKVPSCLAQILKLIPYVYLGLGALFAATGTAFVICRLDPFVPIFRLSGKLPILMTGIVLLLIGIFVARPYCRFLCPFSVLLNWMSKLSKWHATITPDECVKCRLCEKSCPFDAIQIPNINQVAEPRISGVHRLIMLLILLPFLAIGGGWAGSRLDVVLARENPTVRLAEAIQQNDQSELKLMVFEKEAFDGSGMKKEDLYVQAHTLRNKFRKGGWFMGGFLGVVFGCSLIGVSIKRTRDSYEPDRGACLSCARCFMSCPKEHQRIKKLNQVNC